MAISSQTAWIMLLIAALFEVVWATLMKSTVGFTKLWPTVATVAAMIVSFTLLGLAVKTLPVGTAYAVWTGIGAVGTVIAGVVLYKEATGVLPVLFMALIIGGIIGLKVTSGA